MKHLLLASAAGILSYSAAFADSGEGDAAGTAALPEIVTVIGLSGDAGDVTGSAAVISPEDLDIQGYGDITRILRQVPGIYLQEEDGFGLRPNIGLRGTGLDRSAKITLMEDGVLIAPAPYASPAAYYFPHAARMAGVEIIKGAAGVRYGPQTQGGSINLLSTPVPDDLSGALDLRIGEENSASVHGWFGGMGDIGDTSRLGGLFEVLSSHSDGFKTIDNAAGTGTGFDIRDFVGKLRFETRAAGADHLFELKGQVSSELSNETYLGLTDADFAASPYRRYAASQFDEMDADHSEISLRHQALFGNGLEWSSVIYRTDFERDWFKTDRVDFDGSGPGGAVGISAILDDPVRYSDEFAVLRAPAGFVSADDALLLKHNHRAYFAQGIQSELAGDLAIPGGQASWRVGARLHEDEMDRFQWYERFAADDGDIVLTGRDVPGTESNRIESAEAAAVFAQAEMSWGALTLVPGLRYESVELTRRDYGKADPQRTGANLAVRENSVDWVAPGLGARYEIGPRLSLFGGIHRGYAPPAPGSTTAEPEDGTNYEAGLRYAGEIGMFELVGFFNDYDNILGSCTLSTGGGCTVGDQFDGGEAEVRGVEIVAETDLGAPFDTGFALPIRAAYTYTDAEFSTGFNSDFEPWGVVEPGDALPYIPEHQLYLSAGLVLDRAGAQIAANWVDDVRTVAGQGEIPGNALIESRWVADLALWYTLTERVELRGEVRNLFDETYAVARRPAGLRPGAPRAVTVGVNFDF
jgi:Fe(3+) dicitrate transport protein